MAPPSPTSLPHGRRRIGMFGGSFDPLHNGHLLLAECCRDQAQLDEVWFVPAAVQPHKPDGPVANNEDRCEMIRLGIADCEGFRCSLMEIERGGVSYTVETLRELCRTYPNDDFFLLMGADTLHDLPLWREPGEILRMASPVVVSRAGEVTPNFAVLKELVGVDRLAEITRLAVHMPATDVSSSQLRERIAAGESIKGLAPPKVVEFIERQGPYRQG